MSYEYIREFSQKLETALIGYSGAWGKRFKKKPEAEFLNFYGAQESISRNQFRQPMYSSLAGPYDNPPYSYSVSPHSLFKNTSTEVENLVALSLLANAITKLCGFLKNILNFI